MHRTVAHAGDRSGFRGRASALFPQAHALQIIIVSPVELHRRCAPAAQVPGCAVVLKRVATRIGGDGSALAATRSIALARPLARPFRILSIYARRAIGEV